MLFREYANGTIIEEDLFSEYDNASPYYDDYREYYIPETLYDHIFYLGEQDRSEA